MEIETIQIFRRLRNSMLDEIEILMEQGKDYTQRLDQLAYVMYIVDSYDMIHERGVEAWNCEEISPYCNGDCDHCTVQTCSIKSILKGGA